MVSVICGRLLGEASLGSYRFYLLSVRGVLVARTPMCEARLTLA
jgi:hypothetical protein